MNKNIFNSRQKIDMSKIEDKERRLQKLDYFVKDKKRIDEIEIPMNIVSNVKQFARKNCNLRNHSNITTFNPALIAIAATIIIIFNMTYFFIPEFKVNMYETQVMYPDNQINYILNDVLSNDDHIFQYAMLEMKY